MSEANTMNITIENDHHLPTLYQVSVQGDVVGLRRLIQEDTLILDRVSVVTFFNETPLHIAAMRGHSDFAKELVNLKPELAGELDSLRRVPLHWACEKGFTDVVTELLQKSPDACFLRDHEGRVPLHLAAMKGRNDVVLELVRSRPESIREKVENGGTILHLCVKYNNLHALKLLVEETAEGSELANATDDHGNTILHLAVIFKQVQITKYLLSESIDIQENELNANGFTALDAAEHSAMDSKAMEIKILLLEAGVEKRITRNLNNPTPKTSESTQRGCFCFSMARNWKNGWNTYMKTVEKRFEQARGNTLLAATVTASMAFQAGMNPPKFTTKAPDPQLQVFFWLYNSISLIFSVTVILLMQSGIPFRNKFTNALLVFAVCVTVISITSAYYCAVKAEISSQGQLFIIEEFALKLLFLFCMIIIVHFCIFVLYLVFKILKFIGMLICGLFM